MRSFLSLLSFQDSLDEISRAYLRDVETIDGLDVYQFALALSNWWDGHLNIFLLTGKIFAVLAQKSALELLHGLNNILRLKGSLPRLHCSLKDDFVAIINADGSRIYLLSQLSSPSSTWAFSTDTWIFSTEGLRDDETTALVSQLDKQTARWAIQLLLIELKLRHLEISARKRCMKVLHSLVQNFQVLPPSLFLHNVVRKGHDPVSGGGYADIFKGFFNSTPVCLKALRIFQIHDTRERVKLLKAFCHEALLWTQLEHPNILSCFGVSMDVIKGRLCLISPWMANGNIMEFLKLNPTHDRLEALIGVARGLSYLHGLEPQIVHGDIKGVNILVTEDGQCCLADFGLCVMVESHTAGAAASSSATKGTARWLAPELLMPSDPKFHNANKVGRDIYAFACTVLEIFTGKPPFPEQKIDAAVIFDVLQGKRPTRPSEMQMQWLDIVWETMEDCWLEDSHCRPHAEDIIRWLEAVSAIRAGASVMPHSPVGMNDDETLSMSYSESPDDEPTLASSPPNETLPLGSPPRRSPLLVSTTGTFTGPHISEEEKGINRSLSFPSIASKPKITVNTKLARTQSAPFQESITRPTLRNQGWMYRLFKPLEEFIDESIDPREYYTDLQEIAEGGSGSVFSATLTQDKSTNLDKLQLLPHIKAQDTGNRDKGVQTSVAIKIIKILPGQESTKLQDVKHELILLKGLMHMNVLGMDALYVDSVEDALWIRMELMEWSLAGVISLVHEGLILLDRVIARLGNDILSALQYLHAHGIAHRDVRSDNMLLNSQGILKLTDFSNAVKVTNGSPACTDVVGIPYWQAPEMRHGAYDPFKADIWSLGAMVWEMAEAEPPFSRTDKLADRWPPLKNPELHSRSLREFLQMCSEPAASRPSLKMLGQSSFINSGFDRSIIVQLLNRCNYIERSSYKPLDSVSPASLTFHRNPNDHGSRHDDSHDRRPRSLSLYPQKPLPIAPTPDSRAEISPMRSSLTGSSSMRLVADHGAASATSATQHSLYNDLTIVLLGDTCVGKTKLAVQFVHNYFDEAPDPTIEDMYRKRLVVDDAICRVSVLDTSGLEMFAAAREQWIREGHAYILVYSVTSRSSFKELGKLRQSVLTVKGDNAVYMIVGAKHDLIREREVSEEEGRALANKFGCEFMETSAKMAYNVDQVFINIVRALHGKSLGRGKERRRRKGVNLIPKMITNLFR